MRYFLIVIAFIITVLVAFQKVSSLNEQLNVVKANEKALILNNDSLKNCQRVLELTNSQLEYFNDSVITEYKKIKKQLGIKNTQSIQYIKETYWTTDTIVIRDTIFQPQVNLDTVIGNQWYNVELNLQYPNKVTVAPSFKSEKYIVVHARRETVDPPKKFFLCRWFQKKHTVLEVNVVEQNPYAEIKENKYIKIIK